MSGGVLEWRPRPTPGCNAIEEEEEEREKVKILFSEHNLMPIWKLL
jgi:hypothetical protein